MAFYTIQWMYVNIFDSQFPKGKNKNWTRRAKWAAEKHTQTNRSLIERHGHFCVATGINLYIYLLRHTELFNFLDLWCSNLYMQRNDGDAGHTYTLAYTERQEMDEWTY